MKAIKERGLKKWSGIALCTGIAALGLTAAQSHDANADTVCQPVSGVITSTITTTNCTAPAGICTQGSIQGGVLHGATVFGALNLAPSAGMPGTEPPNVLSYSGVLSIQATQGTVTARDVGILDSPDLVFTEIDRVVSGTDHFAGASGSLFISGYVTGGGTGFQGQISGELCQ